MTYFDSMFETGAQGLIEQVFGQSCTLVRGTLESDSFTARRWEASEATQQNEKVPEIGDFFYWEFEVAACKKGAALIVPGAGNRLVVSNHASQPMYFEICGDDDIQAVALIDQEKRYRVRTQYVQG